MSLLIVILSLQLISCSKKVQDSDPFLWLENIDGEKALNWVEEHNKSTVAVLEKETYFQEFYKKNLEIYNSNKRIAYPSIIGKYVYNFWKDEKNERGIWRRITLKRYLKNSEDWETVLDIDALNKKEGKKWVYKGVTWLKPENRFCMIRLSNGGGDAVEIREFDTKSKSFVKNGFFVPSAKGGVSWKDYNTLYVRTDFGKGSMTTSGYPMILKKWQRGTSLKDAQMIFKGDSNDVSVGGYVINTPERQYEIVYRGMTFYTQKLFTIDHGKLVKLDIPQDADLQGIFKNQLLINLKTDWEVNGQKYLQGSLISIDYDRFLAGARDFNIVVVPDDKSSISSIANTRNYLLINMLENVHSVLYVYHLDKDKWRKEKVDIPELGTVSIVDADDDSDKFFYSYYGFLTPTSLFFADTPQKKAKEIRHLPAFFNTDGLTVKQNWATSKDGTKIPYFIVSQKDLKYDSQNPTLLYGYGGFEISMKPRYSATIGVDWLEKGGVFVLANIRGGGEFGPKWHLSALKENRQRAYDDFAAVAEDLIHRKITSPQHLGIKGGSNGGLLVGVAFTQRADLYNAVVCRVPLLDMKRFNKLLAGASWMGEYGNPDKAEEWAYIKKYSPYQNIFKDKKYPQVFFNTSTRDDRVHPGHARKMVAKMESLGYPVYYYENMEGGHAAATTNKQSAYQNALIYSYLWKQLK
jgi:prolyl oligopeptidase